MPMFGSSKRHAFKPTPYGNTRRPRRIPRWLTLILAGIVLGAGGLLFLQKSYGPVRLTVEQSEQLHYDLNSANLDKQRLRSQLNQQGHDLKETKATLESQATQLAQTEKRLAQAQNDITLFADAMPADPRGTSPGIRAADFKNNAGQLDYKILVMQDAGQANPFEGVLELIVAGRYPSGKTSNITLPSININVQRYQHVIGSASLPEGFTARQVTIRITRPDTKKLSATRTIRVPH